MNTLEKPSSIKPKQEMKLLPMIADPSDMKAAIIVLKDPNGVNRLLEVCYYAPTNTSLFKITNEYAKYLGFKNRRIMLERCNQMDNSNRDVYHDLENRAFYSMIKQKSKLN